MVEQDRVKYIQNLGASLVREYLFRSGLKSTLKSMDDELPRTPESFNNRILLAQELRIDHLVKEYKQTNFPVKSVLEIMVHEFLIRTVHATPLTSENTQKGPITHFSREKWSRLCAAVNKASKQSVLKSQMVNIDRMLWFYRQLTDRGVKIDFQTLVHIYCDCFSHEKQSCLFHESKEDEDFLLPSALKGRVRNGDRDENGEYKDPREEYDETLQETLEYNRMHKKFYPPVLSNSALKEKESILLASLRAFKTSTSYDNKTRLGPDKENTFQNLKRSRSTGAMDQTSKLHTSSDNTSPSSEPDCDNSLRVKSNSISLTQCDVTDSETPENSTKPLQVFLSSDSVETEECDRKSLDLVDLENDPSCTADSLHNTNNLDSSNNTTCNKTSSENDLSLNIQGCDQPQTPVHSSTPVVIRINHENSKKDREEEGNIKEKPKKVILPPKFSNARTTDEDEGMEDCTNESDGDEEIEFVPLKLSTAIALKKLIIGSAIRSFSPQWMSQSFVLSTNPKFRYGFVQNKGGACGVLASVQGFLLKSLLFEPVTSVSETDPLRPTRQEVRRALVHAISEVLWRAGGGRQAVLVRSNPECHLGECLVYRPDGLTEYLSWRRFLDEKDLREVIEGNIDEFISPGGRGCLKLIISAILSCRIPSVLGDMDDESSPLIGPSGTCSLELVNLLLTGRAVSNVFDNDVQLDSCLLRGVSRRSEIGFLSIFEHFNSCQVGSNLKTPRFPIWLVNSDNHFSVVFSPCKQLVSDWRAERQFHLYHYDGLAPQAEETVLSIDTTGFSPRDNSRRENIPPLELCIKTKWKDATVHWVSNSS